ncbi:hypothetical protein [Microbulbifer sp.]|uniref:hypothetical protein n=1 Tax=Microbulbifer sp. TaxID=1908541 RepID=UPI002F95E6B6
MSFLILFGKLVVSFLLLVAVIVGALMANPQWHSGNYRPAAGYASGFIFFIGGLAGFYLLWFG